MTRPRYYKERDISATLRAHPYWSGSILASAAKWGGGVSVAQFRAYSAKQGRADDLLPEELEWIALVRAELDRLAAME